MAPHIGMGNSCTPWNHFHEFVYECRREIEIEMLIYKKGMDICTSILFQTFLNAFWRDNSNYSKKKLVIQVKT